MTDRPGRLWMPPAFEVIPFPTVWRVGKIRQTARMLHDNTRKGAEAYWRRTISDMRRQMERAGIDEDRAEAEVEAFVEAVRCELLRRVHETGEPLPMGDAPRVQRRPCDSVKDRTSAPDPGAPAA